MKLNKDDLENLVLDLLKSNQWRNLKDILADKRDDLVNQLVDKEDVSVREKIHFIDEFTAEIESYSRPDKEEI